jgi:hypothetical protein
LLQELERQALGLRSIDQTVAHPLGQPGLAMLTGVPFIHTVERCIGLLDCHARPFGQYVELGIGNDGGDLDDDIIVGVQTGHFQIDPDEIVGALHGSS